MITLIRKVAFDEPSSTDDGAGGVVGAFVERFICRARFTRLRGGEEVLAARLAGTNTTVIRVRVSASSLQVTTGWRVRNLHDAGEVFNVRSIFMTDDRLYLDITAQSGVAV